MAANDNRTVFERPGGLDVIYNMLMDLSGKDLIDIYHKYPNTRSILESDSFWRSKIKKDFGISPTDTDNVIPRLSMLLTNQRLLKYSNSNPYRIFYYLLNQFRKDRKPDLIYITIYALSGNVNSFYQAANKLLSSQPQFIFKVLEDAILLGNLDVFKELAKKYTDSEILSSNSFLSSNLLYQAYVTQPRIFDYLITLIPIGNNLGNIAIIKNNINLFRFVIDSSSNVNLNELLKTAAKFKKTQFIDLLLEKGADKNIILNNPDNYSADVVNYVRHK